MTCPSDSFTRLQLLHAVGAYFERLADGMEDTVPMQPIMVAPVLKQAATASGAVVLYLAGDRFAVAFYNAHLKGLGETREFFSMAGAVERFEDLCRRFWVGMPANTRPGRKWWEGETGLDTGNS